MSILSFSLCLSIDSLLRQSSAPASINSPAITGVATPETAITGTRASSWRSWQAAQPVPLGKLVVEDYQVDSAAANLIDCFVLAFDARHHVPGFARRGQVLSD